MERIGFGPRLGAVLIDAVIIIILMFILGPMFGAGAMGFAAAGSVTGFSFGLLVLALIPIAYSSTEVFLAGTPGKKVLKLAIRNQDGSPATQEVLLKRWGMKNVGSIFNVVAAITAITLFNTLGTIASLIIFVGAFMALTEEKLALHDKIAKTGVYKTAA